MKILIVSDTHRQNGNLKKVLEKESPIDLMIHLGDAEGSEALYHQWLARSADLLMVKGNNDFFSDLDSEKEVTLLGHRMLLTHGHYYNVSLDTEMLRSEAESRHCEVAMFGHTHKPCLAQEEGVLMLNPGSLSSPRQEGRRPTYMVMDLERGEKPRVALKQL